MASTEGISSEVLNALESGDVDKIKELLQSGACGIKCIGNGQTLLHIACQHGHTGLVKVLCSIGADMYTRDDKDLPPAFTACINSNTDAMLALVELGYDINATSKGKSLLHYACIVGSVDIVQALLSRKEFQAIRHLQCYKVDSPLVLAISNGHFEIALKLFSKFPQSHNYRAINATYGSKSLLHYACETGNAGVVKALLCNEAFEASSHSQTACLGETPSMMALRNDHEEIALELIKQYDDPYLLHKACKNGLLSVVHGIASRIASFGTRDSDGNTPLEVAIRNDKYEVVQALLEQYKCDSNIKDDYGRTPLHVACCVGNLEIVRLLKNNGASVNSSDIRGNTPLALAIRFQWHAIALALLEEYKCDPNSKETENKNTPLHLACRNEDFKIVQSLCKGSANITAVNCFGDTPLSIAVQNRNHEFLIEMLGYARPLVLIFWRFGTKLLHIACSNGDIRMIHILCNRGINVNDRGSYTDPPVFSAAKNKRHDTIVVLHEEYRCDLNARSRHYDRTLLHIACGNGDIKLVQLLSAYGLNLNIEDANGYTPFILAVTEQQYEVVSLMLKEYGCDPNVKSNKHALLPLHIACKNNDPEMIHLLTKYRANVNVKDVDDSIPLILAVKNMQHEVALALVSSADCDCSIRDEHGRSPLHLACGMGDLKMVRLLCCCGADINLKDDDDDTPFCFAVASGQYDVTFALLEEFKIDPNNNDRPLLHVAFRNGYLRILQLLCDYEANVNARDIDGNTVLALAISNEDLALSLLKRYNTDLSISNNYGITPLHIACSECDVSIVHLLCEQGADIHARDNYGDTPLTLALTKGRDEVATVLVEKYNCDPNTQNINGTSPLHLACKNSGLDIVCSLCDHGADGNSIDKNGDTPLSIAVQYRRHEVVLVLLNEYKFNVLTNAQHGQSLLHTACRTNDLKMVHLLCKHGADLNMVDNDGNTPLAIATAVSTFNIALALLDHGCDPHTRNNAGRSPLHLACTIGYKEVVLALIEKHNADPNCTDESQNTPLMAAVKGNQCSIVETLVSDYGCDVGIQGCGGSSLLHMAAARGKISVLELLLDKYGMSVSVVDEAGNTPLHVASKNGESGAVRTLLYDYVSPIYQRNKAGSIPSDLALDDSIRHIFSSYLRTHNVDLEKEYASMQKLATSRYSGSYHIARLFVVGHRGAGKSSLVETFKREGFLQSFTRISVKLVPPHTAGIVPSVHTSTTYGRVQFYDFAGDYEYYSSHAAILERLFNSSIGVSICIVVLNLQDSEAEIEKNFVYWHSFIGHSNSNTSARSLSRIVVGSHRDVLSTEELKTKSDHIVNLVSKYEADYVCLDCCNPRDQNISQLRQKISNISKECPAYALSNQEALLIGLLEKDFSNVTACTMNAIASHIQDVNLMRLPRSLSGLSALLEKLQAIGILLMLSKKGGDCYLVLNVAQLTNEVHKELFSDDAKSILASYNIGLLPPSILHDVLPQYITKECLIQLQYCQEISHIEIDQNNAITTTSSLSNVFLFFPALCKLDKKEVDWLIPPEGSYSVGWLATCSHHQDYFPPRFLHVLLLRIAVRFTLAVSTDEIGTDHLLKRRCKMWKTGVHWLTEKGVECEVDVDINKEVVVCVRSEENSKECLTLFNSIISCVMEAKAEFCLSLKLKYYLLDRIGCFSNNNLYALKEVEEALQKNSKKVVSVQGDSWMSCSKLKYIRCTFWGTLFSIDEIAILGYIRSLVKEWFELGQCLRVPISTLKAIESDYAGDVYRQKVEMVVTWLSSTDAHPPCWWSLVKALKEMSENMCADEIIADHGEHVDLQKKLFEPGFSKMKPDAEFLLSFSRVVEGKWPYLASLLSLSSTVIQEIRTEGEGQSQGEQALLMLKKWSSREGATYGQLQPIALYTLFSFNSELSSL